MASAGEGGADAQAQRFEVLRPTMHKVITREVGLGNVRVILWLAISQAGHRTEPTYARAGAAPAAGGANLGRAGRVRKPPDEA